MSDYLELTFDIFDEPDQKASALKTLTAEQMIREIIKEFEDLDQNNAGNFALTLKDTDKPLEAGKGLFDQGVQDGDILIFNWARGKLNRRKPLTGTRKAVLREEVSGAVFPIEWQPAIIGRPDIDPTQNELLAANVEWLPNSRRVSRWHARISEKDGEFFLEALVSNNATYINGAPISVGAQAALRTGDKISLGMSKIVLTFLLVQ